MEHAEVGSRIGDLVRGRLEGSAEAEALSHVRGCEECQALAQTYLVLAETWEHEHSSREHATVDEIVRLAVDPDSLSDHERRRLSRHAETCIACRMETEAVQQAEHHGVSHEGRRYRVASVAMAAGIVLALLAYPVYLGLVEKPRTEARLRAELNRVAEWSGPVSLTVLRAPHRTGVQQIPLVTLAESQPHVPLAIAPELDLGQGAPDAVHFEIGDRAGRVLWSHEMSLARVEEYLRSPGVVTLLVPSELLPDGQYGLRLRSTGEPGTILFEAPFRVARGD